MTADSSVTGTGPGRTVAWLDTEINRGKTSSVRDLGPIDIGSLKTDLLALPDSAWDREDDYAANYNKRGAIRSASHIILRFCDRRSVPSRCYDLPAWDEWAERLLPILETAAAPFGYAEPFFPRIMFARLPAGAFIAPHVDGEPRVSIPHKIHVPVVTHPQAFFFVEDERYHLTAGRAYEVNNAARHSVVNGGSGDRIHLIFECLDARLQTFL